MKPCGKIAASPSRTVRMPEILAIPAFADNYIWMLRGADDRVAVVDPGDAAPVQRELDRSGGVLAAILLTHHHADHIGGAVALASRHGCEVYAPEDPRIAGGFASVREGDRVELTCLGMNLEVLEIPGHTRSHIAFVGGDSVFCGDTLFSAGCGRMFEGTPVQMHRSLERLASLPGQTRVYCGHEYTLANLAFAREVEPGNAARERRLAEARALRGRGEPTLPATIAEERRVNPFLRCDEPAVRQAASRHAGRPLSDAVEVFAVLRAWKDGYRAPAA